MGELFWIALAAIAIEATVVVTAALLGRGLSQLRRKLESRAFTPKFQDSFSQTSPEPPIISKLESRFEAHLATQTAPSDWEGKQAFEEYQEFKRFREQLSKGFKKPSPNGMD